jgi:hypothetical protein
MHGFMNVKLRTSVYDTIWLLLLYTNFNSDAGEAYQDLMHFFRLDGPNEAVQYTHGGIMDNKCELAFNHTCWHAVRAAYEIKIHKQYSKCQYKTIPYFTQHSINRGTQ